MQIGNKTINEHSDVFIIAEVGANHCHSSAQAAVCIAAAAKAGADAVKFQTFDYLDVAVPGVDVPSGHDARLDAYMQKHHSRRFASLFYEGGLPLEWHKGLHAVAEDHGIIFLSTPFSVSTAKFLVEEIGVPAIKVASGDLTFVPLLQYLDTLDIPIILSTGCATSSEIEKSALHYLYRVYLKEHIALLHCRSVYPCPEADAGLSIIPNLIKSYPLSIIGFSDHTTSIDVVPALATSLGAKIYEKHLRLDIGETMDTGHSILPSQFRHMVDVIRNTPKIIGFGYEYVLPAEKHDRLWARRDPSDWLRPMQEARDGRWE